MAEIWRPFLPAPQGEPFADLNDPSYQPGLWWLPDEPQVLEHWSPILRNNFDYLVHLVEQEGDDQKSKRAKEARVIFRAYLDDLDHAEARELSPTIHHLTLFREALVRAHNLGDPYRTVKKNETTRAIRRLMDDPGNWGLAENRFDRMGMMGSRDPRALLAGVMSGNLFDLGSALTQKAFREGKMGFGDALEKMSARIGVIYPEEMRKIEEAGWRGWLLETEPQSGPLGEVLLFVDNAGADFVLGILPLAVSLTHEWEKVYLAMNSTPASNDMTLAEGGEILQDLRSGTRLGMLLDTGRICLVGTETGTPGIDLQHVGEELNRVAKGVEAIILEGQGRGVETTWRARFRKPILRLAVIKDSFVAEAIGWDLLEPLFMKERT
ncbi:MAG: DUF89 family protein [Candidatus Eisenbacteria bacterium]|nr:DUF89 family protein [Candidatus Eisenbacteria bacterium]MBU1947231.1 DUF89 family protein [Candidatus Eisenbacteria bacterium]